MIKNDFFTTQTTTEPNTGNIVTNTLNALNIAAPSNAYWLGWIKPENTPTAFKFSSYSVSPQQIQFFDITEPNNYDIGYLSGYNTNNYTYSNIVLPNNPINTQLVRYINKLDCMGVGITHGNVALRFRVYVESGLTNDEMTGRTVREFGSPSLNTWQYMSMKDFFDFLHGNYTLQLSVQGYYNGSSTVNIKLTNADEMGVVYVETTSEYNGVTYYDHIYFTIADYMFTTMRSQTAASGTLGQSMSVVPAIGIHANDNYFVSCTHSGLKSATVGNMNFDGTWYGTSWNNNTTGFSFGVLIANPIGTIPASLKTQSGFAIFTGNIMVWNRVNVRYEISRVFTAADILKHLSLFPRIVIDGDATAPNPQYGYYDNHSYATHVTDTNEFLAELITGDLTDDTFKEKLRLWQWDNTEWEENNYTEEDRPPYEPPEPSEDLPDSYGSDVLPDLNLSIGAIGGFITQYCLNATQVASFGSYLWANIFSTQFVESVGTMLLNDFSINPADILKYIVSLRCYPFDLATVSGFNSVPDTIYFGRGVVGIPMAGIGTMDNLVATFGGENIEVPRLHNDFRDYEPYTRISLNIPFCGQIELTPSEVVGKNIFITYTVDFTSGNIQANAWVSHGTEDGVDYIIGSASGTIGANIQLSASNGMDMLQKIGSTVATFVKTAGQIAAIAAMGGAIGESIDVKASEYGLSTDEVNALYSKSTANAVSTGSGISSALVSAPEASSLPVHAKTVGGGFTSFATPRAYLIVERKKYVVPPNYNHVYGKATNITVQLKEVSGFTVCRNVDLSGIPATQDELAALEALLQSGVYL